MDTSGKTIIASAAIAVGIWAVGKDNVCTTFANANVINGTSELDPQILDSSVAIIKNDETLFVRTKNNVKGFFVCPAG